MQATLREPGAPAQSTGPFRDETPTATAASSGYAETVRRLLIVIALYAIPAMLVMQPVQDLDIWWHLRTGQWIVEHRAVPVTDPFSSFGPR